MDDHRVKVKHYQKIGKKNTREHKRRIRSGDKVMNKKLLKLEEKIIREIATPKHKYLKFGKLSIHLDKAKISICTEGRYHDPIHFPRQIRILFISHKKLLVKTIPF